MSWQPVTDLLFQDSGELVEVDDQREQTTPTTSYPQTIKSGLIRAVYAV